MQISDKKNRPIKVGVISLWALTLFLICFIVYVIGTNQKLFTSKYALYMFIPNAQGLNRGAFITLSGLKVGVVGELKFTRRDNQQGIQVQLKIDRSYANMITTSSMATINTMGILGDKYVDISLGELTDRALPEGTFIPTGNQTDMSAVFASAGEAINEFQITLKNLNKLAEGALNGAGILGMLIADKSAQGNLANLLANLNGISNRIEMGQGNIGQLVHDTTLYVSLKKTAANFDKISTKIQQGEGSLGKLIADTTLYSTLTSVSMLTDSLLQNLQAGKGTAGKLMKDERIYEQLLLLTKSLNTLTDDIKQNPKKYVTIKVF